MEGEGKMGLPPPPPSCSSATTWVRRGCIGRGSFGTVSLAVDKSSGRVFAVKSVRLGPSSASTSSPVLSLENEIRTLRSLSSPYIVSYLGEETTAESPTVVYRNLLMEYVPGGTVAGLAARCREWGGALGEPAVRSYTRCVARALRYLHGAGVVHGDVKGRNVLVGPHSGDAKLADFGSARRISGGGGAEEPAVEHLRGTPLWMAPEVVRGEGTSPASDVWSLGCTVVEMATGKAPWSESGHEDAGHLLLRIALGDGVPEFPAQLSKTGRDFLDKCLRRDPAERWSCEQLLRHPFLAETAGEAEPSPRSALEWANSGFDSSEEDEEERCFRTVAVGDPSDDSGRELRERVRDLASNREVAWEDSEDWEVVRSSPQPLPPGAVHDPEAEATAEGGRERTPLEYLECGASEESDCGEADAAGCSSPSARCSGLPPHHCRRRRRCRGGSTWRRRDGSGNGTKTLGNGEWIIWMGLKT